MFEWVWVKSHGFKHTTALNIPTRCVSKDRKRRGINSSDFFPRRLLVDWVGQKHTGVAFNHVCVSTRRIFLESSMYASSIEWYITKKLLQKTLMKQVAAIVEHECKVSSRQHYSANFYHMITYLCVLYGVLSHACLQS